MTLGEKRAKVLYGLARARGHPHRYTRTRWIVATLATVGIALVPACDVLRFDLWRGQHVWLGETLGFADVAKRFALPFLAINIAIILATRFLGRYLCGFVCPYGALSRAAQWLTHHARRPAALALTLAASFALAAIVVSYWVDWRVFRDGSNVARTLAGVLLASITGVAFVTVRALGLRFCRDWCPSGVYFALLGHESASGVHIASAESCIRCNACDASCPMDLAPRELSSDPACAGRGVYPEALTSLSLCIRCGDCVAACEQVTARQGTPPPLALGMLPRAARDATHAPRAGESDPRAAVDEGTSS